MKNRYRTLVLICFVSAGALTATAGAQNFAGTVTAENLEQRPVKQEETTPRESVGTDPLSPEPTVATEDSNASVEIPEAIATMSHYTVGETDVLEITVMRHPEVSDQFVINSEGNIQYEFVGDLNVLGLTKDQVKKLLNEKLSDYIIDPEITVKIVGYNSKIIYVVGGSRPSRQDLYGRRHDDGARSPGGSRITAFKRQNKRGPRDHAIE